MGNPTARVWVELAKPKIGADSPTILYANASPMLSELMGNQITASIDNTGTMRPLISSGKLVALAVTSQKRSKFDPDVPTLKELGLSDSVIDPWFAVFAPKNTPPQIIKKLNADINALQSDQNYIQAKDFNEWSDGGWSPEQLATFQDEEVKKWQELVNRTGIRLD